MLFVFQSPRLARCSVLDRFPSSWNEVFLGIVIEPAVVIPHDGGVTAAPSVCRHRRLCSDGNAGAVELVLPSAACRAAEEQRRRRRARGRHRVRPGELEQQPRPERSPETVGALASRFEPEFPSNRQDPAHQGCDVQQRRYRK